MAVQEYAPVDIHAAPGNRFFSYGYCVLSESFSESPKSDLVIRRFPVAPRFPSGGNRAAAPMGLAVLLVFCDLDGLHRNMDNWWRNNQSIAA